MSTVAKVLIVVNLVLAGAFLASASSFLADEDNWKTRHDKAVQELRDEIEVKSQQITQKDQQITTLERQGREAVGERDRLQVEVATVRQQNDLLTAAYRTATETLLTAQSALEKAQDSLKSNRELIDTLQAERTALADAVRVANDGRDATVRQLNELNMQFENLTAQRTTLENRIEELKGALRSAELSGEATRSLLPEGAPEVPLDQPAHRGRMLTVANNLGVISLGAEDGVKPGFRYLVSRGNDYVTMFEVTDVQARQSSGRSLRDLQKTPMQAGDVVLSR